LRPAPIRGEHGPDVCETSHDPGLTHRTEQIDLVWLLRAGVETAPLPRVTHHKHIVRKAIVSSGVSEIKRMADALIRQFGMSS